MPVVAKLRVKKLVRTVEDAIKRHRLEIYRDSDDTFEVVPSEWTKKTWRAEGSTRVTSYAAAIVKSAKQYPWVGPVLMSQSDWRLNYRTELLRGLVFRFAQFSETEFGTDHEHCSACMAKIMDRTIQARSIVAS